MATLLDKVIHFLKGCRGHRALLSPIEIFGCFDLYNTLCCDKTLDECEGLARHTNEQPS